MRAAVATITGSRGAVMLYDDSHDSMVSRECRRRCRVDIMAAGKGYIHFREALKAMQRPMSGYLRTCLNVEVLANIIGIFSMRISSRNTIPTVFSEVLEK